VDRASLSDGSGFSSQGGGDSLTSDKASHRRKAPRAYATELCERLAGLQMPLQMMGSSLFNATACS
jgi:hypothetical protein